MAKVVLENIYKTYKTAPQSASGNQVRETQMVQASGATSFDLSGRGTPVLRRINLTVNDGEFLVLVGPSGCGKSTLLRLIAGLEEVSAGNIWVGDRRVNPLPPKDRDIAMVFQSYALYPHLTVYDNLAFGLRRRMGQPSSPGWSASLSQWGTALAVTATRPLPPRWRYQSRTERQIQQQVHQVAQMLQIESLLDRRPRQLSGGQKQRVALGRAIARNPQVFLMDEPLSNLDAKLRSETRAQIVNLQRQLQVTTLYVTHDQVEAMTMGQRIAVMDQGQIQQVATPLDLYHHPANRFVAEFIGSPPMNLIPVQVKPDTTLVHPQFQLKLPSVWEPDLFPYVGRSLLLGIRPEHLQVAPPTPYTLPGRVHQVEALGSDTYLTVHLAGSGESLQVRAAAELRVQVGQALHLAVQREKLHLFEEDTGQALTLPPG